jgi:hypothetical protein
MLGGPAAVIARLQAAASQPDDGQLTNIGCMAVIATLFLAEKNVRLANLLPKVSEGACAAGGRAVLLV